MSCNFTYANNDVDKNGDKKPTYSFYQGQSNKQNNWFIGASTGVFVYFGDHDKQLNFGDRIASITQISGGKWINSSIGVRGDLKYGTMRGLTQFGETNGLSTGKKYRDIDDLWYQRFGILTAHADVLFNLTNDIYGYDPSRFYTIIPFAGLGFISAVNKQKGTSVSFNLGVVQSFKVTDQLNIDLDITGGAFRDKVDGEIGGRSHDGMLSVIVGVKWNFLNMR